MEEWEAALEMALESEFSSDPPGVKEVRGSELKLVSDNGSQPTSTKFMRNLATLGIEQVFTSYDNPKGNAETERVIRTLKEELIWLNEFGSFEEAMSSISCWIEKGYNRDYVHSALGYKSPLEFEEALKQQQQWVVQVAQAA